jgi:hypothetical protein
MSIQNFSSASYVSDGDEMPIRLGINESSAFSLEKGCVPGNLGSYRRVGDRWFCLGLARATTVVGKLYALNTVTAVNLTAEIVGNGSTTGFLSTEAAGSMRVTITDAAHLSATTEDFYAKGYIFFTNGTGEGSCLRIRSNSAASSNAVTFDLYEPLLTTLDATTDCIIMVNPWSDMLLCDANAGNNINHFAGVSQCAATVSGTTYMYQWFQTWGPAVVLCGAAGGEGQPVMHDDGGSYDGGVDEWDLITDLAGGQVGTTLAAATTAGDYQPTYLTLSRG